MLHRVIAAFFIASLAGCSSSDDTNTPPTTSSSSSSSSSSGGSKGTSSSSSSSSSSGAATTTVKAPSLESVEKMGTGLHVVWKNNEPECDAIELERQAQMPDGSIMEKYKVAFTLPGEADNKHDTSASADMKYTYRLRCKKGTTYSDYSNEVSGNPVK